MTTSVLKSRFDSDLELWQNSAIVELLNPGDGLQITRLVIVLAHEYIIINLASGSKFWI